VVNCWLKLLGLEASNPFWMQNPTSSMTFTLMSSELSLSQLCGPHEPCWLLNGVFRLGPEPCNSNSYLLG